jgi:hypothetical protein
MFFDSAPPVLLPLAQVQVRLTAGHARVVDSDAAPALVRARLADAYRDAGLLPASSAPFKSLGPGDWERLAILCCALPMVVPHLPALVGRKAVDTHVAEAFVAPARARGLLTREVLGRSPARIEELARAWIAGLGAGVDGETPRESKARLAQLDYAALLARVEKAKLSAEDRVKYLEELQAAQAGVRRGKW